MNRALIFLLVFSASCHEAARKDSSSELPDHGRLAQIQLVDSLGSVTVAMPGRYDTSFSWINRSDCGKPCDEQEYRFQSRETRIIRESGFVFRRWPHDSVDQLTISHSSWVPYREEDPKAIFIRHEHEKDFVRYNIFPPIPIIFDTVEKIHDRNYSIIVLAQKDTIEQKIIQAVTTVQGVEVKLSYRLLSKKQDTVARDFIKSSLDLIRYTRFSLKP